MSTGQKFNKSCHKPLTEWLEDNKATTRYAAEALDPKFPYNLANAIHVIVRDQFEGYPYTQGYKDDILVPFYNVTIKQQRYQPEMTMIPMDW